ncbi:hypothetical protein NCCP2495_05150 [Dietzia sp. NCCP-2495]|nr:hypothetical protein NCCP2495_05150 [Dietzia sp. NCCP-2495]
MSGVAEWNLGFVAELARMLALGPGTEMDYPDDDGYRIDELSYDGTHVRLVWSFPGALAEDGRPVRAGRYMNLTELRAGFSRDDPGAVAEAVVLNDFYPVLPPAADREGPDGIRWLGPAPPRIA